MSVKPKSRTNVQPTPDKMFDNSLRTSGSSSKRLVSRNEGGSKRAEAYLLDLAKKRDELARTVSEVPPSPPHPSQDEDEAVREERINTLHNRVQEAWIKAEGNPADGKWIFLTHVLRMGVTSGRGVRWAGARADLKVPEPIEGWVNAQTEAEWIEWEKKDKAERAIKEKVENWKRKVEPPSAAPTHTALSTLEPPVTKTPPSKVLDRTETTTKVVSAIEKPNGSQTKSKVSGVKAAPKVSTIDPLRDAAPFGFSVVKKPAQVNGKPSTSGKKKAVDPDAEPGPEGKNSATKSDAQDVQPSVTSAPKKNTNIQHISEVSEFSFLPPSFPSSVIQTSTPKPNAKPSKPRKPESIPHATSAPPTPVAFLPRPVPVFPPVSPRTTKTYARHNLSPNQPLEVSASLPAIPPSPTRKIQITPTNANNKRVAPAPASPSDGRALKKARTMPTVAPPTSPINLQAWAMLPPSPHTPKSNPRPVVQPDSSPLSPMPVTPKKHIVPTLTDLLASAKKGKGSPRRASTKPRSRIPDANNIAKPLVNDAEAQLARKEPIPSRFPSLPAIASAPPFDEDNPYMLDPYAISVQRVNPDLDLDDLPVDIDLQSPTKSLSSLAGSDSEDDDKDELEESAPAFRLGLGGGNELDLDLSFHPAAASTQHGPFVARKSYEAGVSEDTGDSWASVYGAAAGGGAPGAPRPPASSANSLRYAYNSQFESEVAKQVDRVDKLLEKDVDYDYDGWLKDPDEDEDEEGGVGGFGQNSLGVGGSPSS